MSEYIYIIIAAVIGLLAAAFCVLWSRRYVKKTFDAIDATLDAVLAKQQIKPALKVRDDRISKLNHKAQRIMDMYISDATLASREKATIQGYISDLSHQMKTPLSGISMYTELLMSTDISEDERKEFTGRVKTLSDRLTWMMSCLIKMSRLEAGAIELIPSLRGIRQTLCVAVESVIAAAVQKNIRISVAEFADMELFHDRKWTAEVFANILENAIKYSAPDSEISIIAERLSLFSRIVITDNGIGIPPGEIHAVFSRFYRGSNVKDSEGAGLGLYLAALIMEKQGGYILADSKPGHTSFSLFLQNCKN